MVVTIVASYNVTPNQQTPKDPLWLSDSDQIGNLAHVPTIYVYKAKHDNNTIERMRNSLSKILVHFYPVAGRLSLTKCGRMELDCNGKGVTLIEAETTDAFGDYGDFSPSDSIKELVPKVDYTKPIEEIPLLLLQLTRFHGGDGQGFVLGAALSHPLGDGISAARFFNAWAKLARGEALEPNEIPFLDRTVLKLTDNPTTTRVELPKWEPVAAIEEKKTSTALLKLTSSQVEMLKKKANDQPLKEGVRPYSRFEAISAHVWRCASKARESGENHPTIVRFSVDIRSRLSPPLPQNYFGNALAKTVTPNCYLRDITSNPLSYAAMKIREAVSVVTDEYIRSQLNFVLSQELLDRIRDFFSGEGQSMGTPYTGNYNILLASWMSMPVYEADFGYGKPVHFGLGSRFREERTVIMQSSDGDGVVVSVNFQTAHMQLFKKFFYQDICPQIVL